MLDPFRQGWPVQGAWGRGYVISRLCLQLTFHGGQGVWMNGLPEVFGV